MNAQTEASIRDELFYLEEQLRRDRVSYEPDNAAAIRRCELLRDRLNSRDAELGDGGHKIEPAIVPATVTAKPEAASTATPTKTEGAVSQGVFAYNGKREENIPPAPWRLLEFMENKSEADIEEAYQHAIDEHDKDSTPGAIKGMIFKANQVLLAVTHPKQLSKARGVNKIVWV